jgi:hypothetical protein
MNEVKIESPELLEIWLKTQPRGVAVTVAQRAALRVIPHVFDVDQTNSRMPDSAMLLAFFRAAVIAHNAVNYPITKLSGAASESAANAISGKFGVWLDTSVKQAAFRSIHFAVGSAGEFANFSGALRAAAAVNFAALHDATSWPNLECDCNAIAGGLSHLALLSRPLWQSALPESTERKIGAMENYLLALNQGFDLWVDWYRGRIVGAELCFGLSPASEAAISHRLMNLTDDWWKSEPALVNATLKGWLDEARARVAPPLEPDIQSRAGISISQSFATATVRVEPVVPPQDPDAISYGVNDQGKLDRLPNSDQVHLRDVPDQRRSYNDLREAAAELLAEGQRLGHRLKRALERFLQSLPERFEDAEAYLVWRDANALRRLHRAHREAAKSPEPDEARLEPVVAEGLGGLLDLYNNFAFADDGLRAKDETRISPQERTRAEVEAAAAAPLIEAVLATSNIATPEVLEDIAAEAENTELPLDDPYASQVLDQSNRTERNLFAALLNFGKRVLGEVGKSRGGIRSGAEQALGGLSVTEVAGLTHVTAPLLEFIATNGPALQSYVAVAFASFPHLPDLIANIGALWNGLRHMDSQ